MKNTLIPAVTLAAFFSSTAIADITFGIGVGSRVTRSDDDSADTGLIFNLGYQF